MAIAPPALTALSVAPPSALLEIEAAPVKVNEPFTIVLPTPEPAKVTLLTPALTPSRIERWPSQARLGEGGRPGGRGESKPAGRPSVLVTAVLLVTDRVPATVNAPLR